MCATMKYVSWMCTSTAVDAMKMPDRPPMTNIATNAIAFHIAAVKRMFPPHKVPSQLNVLIADGTAMKIVDTAKVVPSVGFMPDWNMWCAHTMKPRNAIPAIAYTIGRYPKIGLREKALRMTLTLLIAGRIMM